MAQNGKTFLADDKRRELVFDSLQQLFIDIKSDIDKSLLINPENRSANLFLFKKIRRILKGNDGRPKDPVKQLINAYTIGRRKYLLKLAFFGREEGDAALKAIVTIIAELDRGKVLFSSPILNRTKSWKSRLIGRINYFYKNALNEKVATDFDKKNREIAEKFGFAPKNLTFYKCVNYDEVQMILGIDFDSESAGIVQSSEAFENTIITGVNSEDFSHDVFHMYVETKFPDSKHRNFIAEEGYANSIANAYYAKNNGEIISRVELVFYLKEYLEKTPNTDLLELFQKNPRVYYQLSDNASDEVLGQLSVKSTIASLLCDEVEKMRGFEGLIKLLRSGKGEDAFFDSLNSLVGINKSNFDKDVRTLISNFTTRSNIP